MKHKKILVFLLSVIVGLIFSLENILPYLWTKTNQNVIYTVFNGGDENLYAAEIREVYEGKLFSGDAFIYENRQKPPFTQWLGLLVMGLLAKVFGSLESVHILGDFFFPAGIFLLIFVFVNRIIKHYWGTIVISLATLFLFQLTTKLPPVTPQLLHDFVNLITLRQPIIFGFSRLVTRQFSFTVFLLFIMSFYQNLISRKKIWPIITGMLSGLLIYTYVYYWTASVVILWVGFILKRNKSLFLAGCCSILVSSYFLAPYLFGNLLDRQIAEGRINGRFFEPLTTLRYGLFSLLVFFIVSHKHLQQFLLSIFLAAVILMNLQLILGYTVDPGHWPNAVFEPLLVMASGLLVFSNRNRLGRFKFLLGYSWVLIFPILFYAAANQLAIAKEWLPAHQLSKDEQQIFNYLNTNSRPESVVLTLDKRLNRYLPALTSVYVYLPYGTLTQLTIDQIWERLNLAFSIYRLSPEVMQTKLKDTQLVGHLFEQTYNYINIDKLEGLEFPEEVRQKIRRARPVFNLGVRYIPDNIKKQQIQKAVDLEKIPLEERLCRYRLNYVIVTVKDQASVKFFNKDIFQPVLENVSLSLYEINPQLCRN